MELRPGIDLILGTLVLGRTILYIEQGLCAREVYTVKKMGDSQTVGTQNSEKVGKPRPVSSGASPGFDTFSSFPWIGSQERFSPRHQPRKRR